MNHARIWMIFVSLVLSLTGCADVVSDFENMSSPSSIISESETEETAAAKQDIVPIEFEQEASDSMLDIRVRDFGSTFSCRDPYTSREVYRFRINKVRIAAEQSYDGEKYNISMFFTGRKEYDEIDGLTRPVKLMVRVLDSEGIIVHSETVYSTSSLAAGETFDDEKWGYRFTLEAGSYTLEVEDVDYLMGVRLTEQEIMPDPKRWYSLLNTVSGSLSSKLSDDQKTALEGILSELSRLNVGIDDEFRLSGFTDEPIQIPEDSVRYVEGYVSFDQYLGEAYMFDLPEQISLPVVFPEDLKPDRIWINYLPYGDSVIGERPRTTIAMMYLDSQGDSLGTIQVLFFPGYSLSDEDWGIVKENAAEADIPLEDW